MLIVPISVRVARVTDDRARDEPHRHDCGPVARVRADDARHAGHQRGAGDILAFVGVRAVQLEPERAGRHSAAGEQERRPGDDQSVLDVPDVQ